MGGGRGWPEPGRAGGRQLERVERAPVPWEPLEGARHTAPGQGLTVTGARAEGLDGRQVAPPDLCRDRQAEKEPSWRRPALQGEEWGADSAGPGWKVSLRLWDVNTGHRVIQR